MYYEAVAEEARRIMTRDELPEREAIRLAFNLVDPALWSSERPKGDPADPEADYVHSLMWSRTC